MAALTHHVKRPPSTVFFSVCIYEMASRRWVDVSGKGDPYAPGTQRSAKSPLLQSSSRAQCPSGPQTLTKPTPQCLLLVWGTMLKFLPVASSMRLISNHTPANPWGCSPRLSVAATKCGQLNRKVAAGSFSTLLPQSRGGPHSADHRTALSWPPTGTWMLEHPRRGRKERKTL